MNNTGTEYGIPVGLPPTSSTNAPPKMVPEPSTLALGLLCLILFVAFKKFNKRK